MKIPGPLITPWVLGLIALFGGSQASADTVTLQFSVTGIARASGFSDSVGTAGVDGMRWGIVVDTDGDGFHQGAYDGEFDINTSGFLTINGGTVTDDYYVAHPDQATTLTSPATGGDPGGPGTITAILGITIGGATNIAPGDPFMLVWFQSGSAAGDSYGALENTSGTGTFLIPAGGATQPYAVFFAGVDPDPVKAASFTFTSPFPGAEIVVQQPAGTNLVDGTATVAYGAVAKGSTVSRQFVIKNVGNSDLTGVGVSIEETGGSNFSIAANPAATVSGPSGSTTFTVQFAPTTAGNKTAVLHVASNDANEDPFDINLTGAGIPTPGTLALNLPPGSTINVNEEAGFVNIPITRTGGSDGSVSVNLTTTNGSAVAPGDFTAQTNAAVTLDDTVTSLNVSITILNPASTSEANETFTVAINGANVTAGGTTTATVRIIDSVDATVPAAPIITFPAAAALVGVNTSATLNITGTATDNKGVSSVKVKLGNGAFVDAVLTASGTASTNWSLAVAPTTGANTITVQSFDTHNLPSTLVTRTFKVTRPLAVGTDTSLATLTAGFSPTSFREVGKSFTITATAKPPTTAFAGAIFAGWTISGQDVANSNNAFTPQRIGVAASGLEKNTLTFIFREGLVLAANFIANPFAPMAGSYQGLIRPSSTLPDRPGAEPDGSTRTNSTEGLFKATVTNTGGFSGTLTIDGTVLNVAGSFDHNGDARFGTARALTLTVARLNKPSLIVALHLDMLTPGTGDNITGSVTATDFKKSVTTAVSTVNADKAFYGFQTMTAGIAINSAVVTLGSTLGRFEGEVVTGAGIPANTTIQAVDSPAPNKLTLTANATITNAAASLTFTRNVPSAYLGAANANGTFTAVFPAEDVGSQTAGFTTQDYPQGDGYATITVTKAGVVTIAGTLADNTAISMTSALSQANTFPLFVQLYTKLGFLSGMVQLDSTQTTSDMAAADLQWLRPFIGTSHYYPYGWPEVIKVDMLGAKYAVVANQSVLKAANGVNIQATVDDDGNAALAFSDGQLSETLNKSAYLSLADVVTKVPDNDPTFTLLITRTTGAISGTITHTDDTVPTYKGTIYQKGPNAGGYGFFLTKQPVPIDYTGESGGVSLIGQP